MGLGVWVLGEERYWCWSSWYGGLGRSGVGVGVGRSGLVLSLVGLV